LLEQVVSAAGEAGASFVWLEMLNLKPGSREHFLSVLAEHFPEQLPLYQRLYARRAYLPASLSAPIRTELDELRRRYGIGVKSSKVRAPRPIARPEPAQLQLRL
jgi:hypothetical protein